MLAEAYAPFFEISGAHTAFMGIWALVFLVSLPFCWGWDDDAGWPEDGGKPKFDPAPAFAAFFFPFWPLAVAVLPAAILCLLILIGGPHLFRKWWDADWSRR